MKKYLLILLGFLMAVLYLHPASVLAEDVQKIAVTYQYIDEDTGEIFKEEKRLGSRAAHIFRICIDIFFYNIRNFSLLNFHCLFNPIFVKNFSKSLLYLS